LEVIFISFLGKFGQKPFAPPNICLLLHLCIELTIAPPTTKISRNTAGHVKEQPYSKKNLNNTVAYVKW